MAEQELDALLRRMPDIASAVNAFTSETVQQEAFGALVTAFQGKHRTTPDVKAAQHIEPADDAVIGQPVVTALPAAPPEVTASNFKASKGEKAPKKKSTARSGGFNFMKDLNLFPEGKQSFADFASEKSPITDQEKYAVVIYYLEHILELEDISVDTVGSVFRLYGAWKEPTGIRSGINMTSHRKGTIDTSDWNSLKTTPAGRNLVKMQLPKAAIAK